MHPCRMRCCMISILNKERILNKDASLYKLCKHMRCASAGPPRRLCRRAAAQALKDAAQRADTARHVHCAAVGDLEAVGAVQADGSILLYQFDDAQRLDGRLSRELHGGLGF